MIMPMCCLEIGHFGPSEGSDAPKVAQDVNMDGKSTVVHSLGPVTREAAELAFALGLGMRFVLGKRSSRLQRGPSDNVVSVSSHLRNK